MPFRWGATWTEEGLMLTGELRTKIDAIWDSFWSGGISNPLEVMEQITYLLFLKRLDNIQTLKENKANRLGEPIESPIFPAGSDEKSRLYADFRWSRFKNFAPAEMFPVVGERIVLFLRTLGGDGSERTTPPVFYLVSVMRSGWRV
jgi:type I restriction enzyme M protein